MMQFLEMLEFMRPAGTPYEEAFIDRYIKPLSPMQDDFGNLRVDIGVKPDILWSSHTDTVHTTSGLQRVVVDKNRIARVKFPLTSNCLGADCTTGVYIMMKMIEAGVPGRYIFHRDEESGGKGSKYIAKNTPDILKGISAAIAFDRKGLTDIITHQSHRTASNDFADSLGGILGMGYKSSPNGSFTDTKSYMGLVPECTNISVGYAGAHSASESQDLVHLQKLIDVMITFDPSNLIIKRTPEEPSYQSYHYTGTPNYHRGGYQTPEPKDLFDLCRQAPMSVSKIFEHMNWSFDDLDRAIKLIQERRENEIDIWDDPMDDIGLPTKLLAAPTKKAKKIQQRKLRVGIN